MTPSVTEVPPELKGLPQAVLDAIHTACAGDWRRVEVTGNLQFLIHNQPQMRRVHLPAVRPRRRPQQRRVAGRVMAAEPEVRELPANMESIEAARIMASEFADGIPTMIRIELSEAVENMPNALVQLAIAACRAPERVEVDPRSVDKDPRLRFVRGGVTTIVAFRNITLPFVIGVLNPPQ